MGEIVGRPPAILAKDTRTSKMRAELNAGKGKRISRGSAENLDESLEDWVRIRNMEQTRQIETLTKHVETLNASIEELERQLAEQSSHMGKEIQDSKQRMEALTSERDLAHMAVDRLEKEILDTQRVLESLLVYQGLYEQLMQTMGLHCDAQRNLPNLAEIYEIRWSAKESEISRMQAEMEKQTEQCDNLKHKLEASEAMIISNRISLGELQETTFNLEQELNETRTARDSLQSSVVSLEQLLATEVHVRSSQEVKIARMEKELHGLKEEIEDLMAEVIVHEGAAEIAKKLQEEKRNTEQALTTASQTYSELRQLRETESAEHREAKQNFELRLRDAEETLSAKDQKLTMLEHDIATANADLKSMQSIMQEKEESYQAQIEDTKRKHAEEICCLRTELEQVQRHFSESSSKWAANEKNYEERVDKISDENEELRTLLEKANSCIDMKEKQTARYEQQLFESREEIEKLLCEAEQVHVVQEECQTLKSKLEDAKTNHLSEIEKLSKSHYRLVQQLQDDSDIRASQLKSELHEKSKNISELQEDLTFALEELEGKSSDLAELNRLYKDLIAKSERTAQRLRDEMNSIKEQSAKEVMKVRQEAEEMLSAAKQKNECIIKEMEKSYEQKLAAVREECEKEVQEVVMSAQHTEDQKRIHELEMMNEDLKRQIQDGRMRENRLTGEKKKIANELKGNSERFELRVARQQNLLSYMLKRVRHESCSVTNQDLANKLRELETNFNEKFRSLEDVVATYGRSSGSVTGIPGLTAPTKSSSTESRLNKSWPGKGSSYSNRLLPRFAPTQAPITLLPTRYTSMSDSCVSNYGPSPQSDNQRSPKYNVVKNTRLESPLTVDTSDATDSATLLANTSTSPTRRNTSDLESMLLDADEMSIIEATSSGRQSPVPSIASPLGRNDSGLGHSHKSEFYLEQLRAIAETLEELDAKASPQGEEYAKERALLDDFKYWKQDVQYRLKSLETGLQLNLDARDFAANNSQRYLPAMLRRWGSLSSVCYYPSNEEIRRLIFEVNDKFDVWLSTGHLPPTSTRSSPERHFLLI